MKLVIDIPEEEYEFCKKQWDTECLDILTIAVKYGIPLPKGHGRLGDLDKLESELEWLEKVTNKSSIIEEAQHDKLMECIRIVSDAKTIIERS